jgi:hypothetical protein
MIDYAASFTNYTGIFPDIEAVNVSAPGADDGTEFVALMVNDIWGRAQALLDYAAMTPDGVMEAPDTAQILTAIGRGFAVGPGMGVTYWKNGAPAANGDRVLLLQGQVIEIASYPLLVTACYVGNAANPTAPAFYKTSDAGGTTRDVAGGYFVLPDTRAVVLKGVGNQTINTRVKSGPAFCVVEEDRFQGHIIGNPANSAKPLRQQTNNYYANPSTSDAGYAAFSGSNNAGTALIIPMDDGTNGTPRTGLTTRDCSIGTNYGITY